VHAICRAYFALFVIYHDVVRLHIAVHYAFAVAEVESFKQLEHVIAYVVVDEFGI